MHNYISDSGLLWSRIVATMKSSLHEDQTTINQGIGYTTHRSFIYKGGCFTGNILFDVTIRPELQIFFLGIIAKAFFNCWGAVFHKERNKQNVIEMHFLSEEDRAEALMKGLVFEDSKSRILPTSALEHEAQVIRWSFFHVPFVADKVLLEGLRTSLVPYDRVLDVGISCGKDYQAYISKGCAVLDISIPEDADEEFAELMHNIP
jgi:hypothetical protein